MAAELIQLKNQETGNQQFPITTIGAIIREDGTTLDTILHNMLSGSYARDLSYLDINGNELSTMNTANCYVIRKNNSAGGWFKLPLVYGCGIKNGKVNSAAYTKVAGTYSQDFINHVGHIITSPYIERNPDCMAVDTSIIWQYTDNMISDLSLINGLDCRYLMFKLNSVPTTGSNAVIGIKDSNNDIIWSWHIWVYPESLDYITITNHTGYEYDILPVNLGWVWDDDTKAHGTNPYFQWGRKDPIIGPAAYNSTTNRTIYGDRALVIKEAETIQAAIKNPNAFFLQDGETYYNWFTGGSKYNLWDANCISTGTSDNVPVKTVYDPCPYGYCVPNGRNYTGFTTTGSNTEDLTNFNVVGSWANGWYFKAYGDDAVGKFFPASGARYRTSGGLFNVGSSGYCWSSAAYSQSYAYLLRFISGYVGPLYNDSRAFGFAVRPAADIL